MSSRTSYIEAAQLLKESSHAIVFTGSGISVDSGIPTFRGKDGVWSKVDPEKVATPQAFMRDPYFVWEWYRLRINSVLKAKPNIGHKIIANWEKEGYIKYVITQNVDNLHRAAGNQNLIELHGNILRIRCTECGVKRDILKPLGPGVPKCHMCGGIMRPDVVWFGEPLEPDILDKAFRIALRSDVVFVIGTSALVYPAAAIPIEAWRNGAKLIEINPEETGITSYAEISIRDTSSNALKIIDSELSKL